MKDLKDYRYHRDSRHDARVDSAEQYRKQEAQTLEYKSTAVGSFAKVIDECGVELYRFRNLSGLQIDKPANDYKSLNAFIYGLTH